VISAALVWATIIMASALVLGATDFQKMLPILAGGAVYFVILVPGGYMWRRQQSKSL
jgi:hypothetical protein